MTARLSIIIPVLDEAALIGDALEALASLRLAGVEVIVVDGGSRDRTVAIAAPHIDRMVAAPPGRAIQMNAGAALARGDILLFLHADTRLATGAERAVLDGLAQSGRVWGRFDVKIEGTSRFLIIVAAMMNLRSRLTGIATGDHAIFVLRDTFVRAGGFPEIPLMEDVALSRRLKSISRPLSLGTRVTTSARRWEKHGIFRTILLMWRLRLAYFLGAEPGKLARRYGYVPGD
jgi:rSAM/selenodomain-associated transferase 2